MAETCSSARTLPFCAARNGISLGGIQAGKSSLYTWACLHFNWWATGEQTDRAVGFMAADSPLLSVWSPTGKCPDFSTRHPCEMKGGMDQAHRGASCALPMLAPSSVWFQLGVKCLKSLSAGTLGTNRPPCWGLLPPVFGFSYPVLNYSSIILTKFNCI